MLSVVVLSAAVLPLSYVSADSVMCPASTCYDQEINCAQGEDCSVDCQGPLGGGNCGYAYINCPTNGNCHVNCGNGGTQDDRLSCRAAIVNCPQNGTCSIDCQSDQACSIMEVCILLMSTRLIYMTLFANYISSTGPRISRCI